MNTTTTVSTMTKKDFLEGNKNYAKRFNTLLDCVSLSENYENFVESFGDDIADFFKFGKNKKSQIIRTNKVSHRKIFNFLKTFSTLSEENQIEKFEENGVFVEFFVGFKVVYKAGQVVLEKFLICRKNDVQDIDSKKDAKNILETAAYCETIWQLRATDAQIKFLCSLCKSEEGKEFLKYAENSNFKLTKKEASFAIENLKVKG